MYIVYIRRDVTLVKHVHTQRHRHRHTQTHTHTYTNTHTHTHIHIYIYIYIVIKHQIFFLSFFPLVFIRAIFFIKDHLDIVILIANLFDRKHSYEIS